MRTFLLFLHVMAAVLFIGPTTVASSRFAAHVRRRQLPEAAAANRTTRIYGWATSVVGAVGVALALRSSLFGEIWVDTALALEESDLRKMERLVVAQNRRVERLTKPAAPSSERPSVEPIRPVGRTLG